MPVPADPVRELLALDVLCGEALAWLRTDGDRLGTADPEVSAWSPRVQLDHAAITTSAACGFVERILSGDAACVPAGPPTTQARMLLGAGRIPRGIAETPDALRPADGVSTAEAQAHLMDARARLAALAERVGDIAAADGRLPHFALGPMTPCEWLTFARIHFEHHAAIAHDIASREPGEL